MLLNRSKDFKLKELNKCYCKGFRLYLIVYGLGYKNLYCFGVFCENLLI